MGQRWKNFRTISRGVAMTGALTSNACNSSVKRSKSIPRKCSSLVNSMEELHELFSEFFALRVRPLVALGPRPCAQHRAGGCLLQWRFLAFHAITLPSSEKVSNPEKLRRMAGLLITRSGQCGQDAASSCHGIHIN